MRHERNFCVCRLRLIFPARLQASIVSTAKLNFCVRNGNRWTLCVKITDSRTSSARFCLSACVSVDLSSRLVSKQVLSAQQSLTSVFGMGTGGPFALKTLTIGAPSGIQPRDAPSHTHMITMAVALATPDHLRIHLLVHLQGFEPGTH